MKAFDLNKPKFERKSAAVGAHEGRILRVIDLGIQKGNENFKDEKGRPPLPKQQLSFIIELADETVVVKDKTLPMVVFYDVNVAGKRQNNVHSKFTSILAATGLLEAFEAGGDFPLSSFLGKAVAVQVEKSAKDPTKTYVSSVSGLSERVAKTVPALVADSFVFDTESPDIEIARKLSDYTRKRISAAMNFAGSDVEKIFKVISDEKSTEKEGGDAGI